MGGEGDEVVEVGGCAGGGEAAKEVASRVR